MTPPLEAFHVPDKVGSYIGINDAHGDRQFAITQADVDQQLGSGEVAFALTTANEFKPVGHIIEGAFAKKVGDAAIELTLVHDEASQDETVERPELEATFILGAAELACRKLDAHRVEVDILVPEIRDRLVAEGAVEIDQEHHTLTIAA